jgi:multiple sugar transport system substrate-binding protein
MKKSLAILLVLLAICQIWAAPQKPLTVWMKKGFVEEQNTLFEQRVREFAAAKKIPVSVELIAYEDFFPKWTAAIASGNLPDISFLGYQEVGQFYNQGLLEDISSVVLDIQKQNGEIFENTINVVSFDGKTYAMPFWGEGTALYYRKDLFTQAGFKNPPDTWEEFRTMAAKLTIPSQNQFGAGIGYGSGNSDAEWLTRSILWAFGGSIFDKNGRLSFDSPNTREAIKFITDIFVSDKSTPPSAIGWNDAGNNTAYLSGQAAMVVNTGSIINALKNNNPDLLAKTGVVVLPKGKAGRFTAGISNNLAIFKDAQNKEVAKELLRYLMEPAWYQKWIDVSAPLALPVYKNLAQNDPVWKDQYNKAFMDSMATFRFLGYEGPYTPWAGKIYNLRLINSLFESIIAKNVDFDSAISNFITEANKAK